MPLKEPLPDSEFAICRRVLGCRKRVDLPRRIFARQAGIDVGVLIRVELGRTPLKYGVAVRIMNTFGFSAYWLATGTGSPCVWAPLRPPEDLGVDDSALFSAVFADKLASEMQPLATAKGRAPIGGCTAFEVSPDAAGRVAAERFLTEEMRSWLEQVPSINLNPLINAILESGRALVNDWDALRDDSGTITRRAARMVKAEQRAAQRRVQLTRNKLLTHTQLSNTPTCVRTLAELMARLKHYTAPRGKKSELAEALQVPLSTLSRYLSGRMEPGGEATLKLLQWVEQQEAKQKAPKAR